DARKSGVVEDAHRQDGARSLAILGHDRDVLRDRGSGVAGLQGVARDRDGSRDGLTDAVDALDELGTTRTHEAREAEDLAAAHRERDRLRARGDDELIDLEHDLVRVATERG